MKTQTNRISELRTFSQQLANPGFKSAKEITGWMGALQAQNYNMSKWAMGIRLPNSTEAAIVQEINSGSIVRTHLLRPTWHFVSSRNIYWISALTAPRIKAGLKHRERYLGLTDTLCRKCNGILERSLRDFNHKTREELISELKKFKINVDDNRASHIFVRAELDGIICSGRQINGKPSYAILREWVQDTNKLSREEALKNLGEIYFTSRGPATIYDFAWWSGLSIGDAKLSVNLNKGYLISEIIQNETYWFTNSSLPTKPDNNEIFLLPAYDEFLISYRDRKSSLSLVENKKVISNNGIFLPTVMQNGQIIGTWRCNIKSNSVLLTKTLFKSGHIDQKKLLHKCADRYSSFIGRKIELI